MAFIPPFYDFVDSTYKLDKILSSYHNRYNIMGDSPNHSNQSSLERWIKRTDEVISCKTDRTSQRDVFKILIGELQCLPKGDEEKKGTMILMGALLHRYFRLIISYEEQPYSLFFTNPLKNVFSCTLFKSIREALQLDSKVNYDTYKKSDRNRLDSMTIVSCLEMFRDYMFSKDDNEKPRWKKYTHFRNEPNFEGNLNELIAKQIEMDKKNKSPVLNQFKAIQFLQSLAKQLNDDCLKINEALEAWGKTLLKDYPNFNQLDVKTIGKHLDNTIKEELLRKKIVDLFHLEIIQSKLEDQEFQTPSSSEDEEGLDVVTASRDDSMDLPAILNHESLIQEMKKAQLSLASYTLFGGYALLLKIDTIPEHLKSMMRKALGEERDSPKNTKDDLLGGISILKDYLESNPDIPLDWSYFGNRKGLEHHISKAEFGDFTVKKTEAFASTQAFASSI